MTVSCIDPRTALIVIDLQAGLARLPFADLFEDVAARAAMLADAFRAAGLPVILVNTDGGAPGRREQAPAIPQFPGWTELVPALHVQPSDRLITKRSPGAFTATGLDAWLRGEGISQVVIAGVATGTGIETTARQAYELGFNVTLAIDAMTDMDPVVHANCVERVFKRFGETGSTEEMIGHIADRARR
ncbi:cysteine hydrolase family protein [uncultured Sphingomonas sp.]|uniref:cysteine hydrolase family protein n=1 Tax=uncultured Sphingomonas sp. TaxID=158754 RepID=UPI0035CC2E78